MVAIAHSDDDYFDHKRPQCIGETLGRKTSAVGKNISWSKYVVTIPEKYRRTFASDNREEKFSINGSMGAYSSPGLDCLLYCKNCLLQGICFPLLN